MLMTGDMLTDDVSSLNSSHFPSALYTDGCSMYGAVIVIIMEELCNAEQADLYFLPMKHSSFLTRYLSK